MICSVVKHLGSGRALKKWGKTLDCISCFPLHFFHAHCFLGALQQNRAQSRLLYLLIMIILCANDNIFFWSNLGYLSGKSFS